MKKYTICIIALVLAGSPLLAIKPGVGNVPTSPTLPGVQVSGAGQRPDSHAATGSLLGLYPSALVGSLQLPPTITEQDSLRPATIVDNDGTEYPVRVYRPQVLPNDPNANQWWTTKVGLPDAWNIGAGTTPTLLAIIDTGFALNHEEFANRWYQNVGELGTTTNESASKLNCSDRGLPLNKSCNIIDDNLDGILDNEIGLTTLQNKSLLNCSAQGLALNKSCNLLDDDGNGYIDDVRGWDFVNGERSVQAGETNPSGSGTTHGTMVAGVAAATGNNGRGVSGVNWQTKILPLQALDDDSYGDTYTVSKAVRYAADQGADVISISLGSTSPDSYLRQAIQYAIAKGSVVVAASGNDGCDCISYPAHYEEVVAVGASDQNDLPTSFSNWGTNLDVIAPGVGITSTTWSSTNPTSSYASGLAGTSFSTPLVAGLLALVRSRQPLASGTSLLATLTEQTARLSLPLGIPKNTTLGYGRVRADATLSRAVTPSVPVQRYDFGQISLGNRLGAYEPIKHLALSECPAGVLGTTEVYRLVKGTTVIYTVSKVERMMATLQGYTSSIFTGVCVGLPTDTPQIIRTIGVYAEFENQTSKF